jgi:hypothetical protein
VDLACYPLKWSVYAGSRPISVSVVENGDVPKNFDQYGVEYILVEEAVHSIYFAIVNQYPYKWYKDTYLKHVHWCLQHIDWPLVRPIYASQLEGENVPVIDDVSQSQVTGGSFHRRQ